MFTQTQYQNEEIRLTEQSFCQLAESIGVVFWMTDVSKNQMIYVSPGYEKIWGRSCSSLYSSAGDWCEAIHVEDRNRVIEAALAQNLDLEAALHRIEQARAQAKVAGSALYPSIDASTGASHLPGSE